MGGDPRQRRVRSLQLAREARRRDRRFKVLDLSQNFGHQLAITAGLAHALGDWVVTIDSDLQDPPELIPELCARATAADLDVVYAVRRSRAGETRFKRWTAAAFYRLLERSTSVTIPLDAGDFRLMHRRVVAALLACPERHRFLRGMVAWLGFRQEGLAYDRAERAAGATKYPTRKMAKLAVDAFTSFSFAPLKAASWLGLLTSMLGFLYGVYACYAHFVARQTVPGWTSLVVLILVLGGVQLLVLGVIGEYLGRIGDQAKGRPLYVVREFLSGEEGDDSRP